MSKKKMNQVYKKGMEAGARPFQSKYEQTTNRLNDINSGMNKLLSNQTRTQKIVGEALSGMQGLDDNLKETQVNLNNHGKEISRQAECIKNIELKMPSIGAECTRCGRAVSQKQIVCSNCGTIANTFPYKLEELGVKDDCLKVIEEISKCISDSNSIEADWLYPELNEKFIKMKKIKALSAKALIECEEGQRELYEKINDNACDFFNNYSKKKIEVAVVGTVKAGKSSLINALIGADLASVNAIPETSILVKYRTTSKGNYLRIQFYNSDEWSELWSSAKNATVFKEDYSRLGADKIKYQYLGKKEIVITCASDELQNVIMEWSESSSPKHFFVKEIEVGYESNAFPNDVYLVDTPGLSDPVSYRSNITRKYIKDADWILACVAGEKLSEQPEFNFLSKVIEAKSGDVQKVFVVATKKDCLSETERIAKRDEFLKRLSDIYNSSELATSRFIFVAAECHEFMSKRLLGKTLESDEQTKFMKAVIDVNIGYVNNELEHSDEIYKYAGINDLLERIEKNILTAKRAVIMQSIEADYEKSMYMINSIANNFIETEQALLDKLVTSSNNDQKEINELIEKNNNLKILEERVAELKNKLEIQIQANQQ